MTFKGQQNVKNTLYQTTPVKTSKVVGEGGGVYIENETYLNNRETGIESLDYCVILRDTNSSLTR